MTSPYKQSFVKVAHARRLLEEAIELMPEGDHLSDRILDIAKRLQVDIIDVHDDLLEMMGNDPRGASKIKEQPKPPQKVSAVPQKARGRIQLKKG
jgi:hypothetical protein